MEHLWDLYDLVTEDHPYRNYYFGSWNEFLEECSMDFNYFIYWIWINPNGDKWLEYCRDYETIKNELIFVLTNSAPIHPTTIHIAVAKVDEKNIESWLKKNIFFVNRMVYQ